MNNFKYTLKEEKAIQEYFINGGNKTAAYKSAYNTSRMKDKTVNEKASLFFAKDKIRARVEHLQKEIENDNKVSKKKIINRLQEIIFKQESLGVDKTDLTAMNKAIDTLNKMLGYNEPEKKETVVSESQQLPTWFKGDKK